MTNLSKETIESIKQNPLLNMIYKDIYENQADFTMMISGRKGSGKSYSALRFIEIFDPDFDVREQVVYTAEEYTKLVQKYKQERDELEIKRLELGKEEYQRQLTAMKGRVILFDEGSVGADNTQWHQSTVRLFKHDMQTIRYLNLITIICLPEEKDFITSVRSLVNLYLRTTKKANRTLRLTYLKPYVYQRTYFTKPGRELKKIRLNVKQHGIFGNLDLLHVKKARAKLCNRYEKYSRYRKNLINSENEQLEAKKNLENALFGKLVFNLKEVEKFSISKISTLMDKSDSYTRKVYNQYKKQLQNVETLREKVYKMY